MGGTAPLMGALFPTQGGGGGGIESVVGGQQIAVDISDPANPVIATDPFLVPSSASNIQIQGASSLTLIGGPGVAKRIYVDNTTMQVVSDATLQLQAGGADTLLDSTGVRLETPLSLPAYATGDLPSPAYPYAMAYDTTIQAVVVADNTGQWSA